MPFDAAYYNEAADCFIADYHPPQLTAEARRIVAEAESWSSDWARIRAARAKLTEARIAEFMDPTVEEPMQRDAKAQSRVDALPPGQRSFDDIARAERTPLATLPVFDAAADDGSPITPPEWIIADWLPAGRVTLLYANGGVGKTTIAQQLMTACQAGAQWFGLDVAGCQTVALLTEDSRDEIRYRQGRINAQLGIGMRDLGATHWLAGIGHDNALVRFDKAGIVATTQRFAQLREAALASGARLIVIDGAAGTFGNGNENDRGQVAAFIGRLTALAMECDAAVLLLAHPSRMGMATGSHDSGSTHWHNACRSRWSFVRPKIDGIEDEHSRVLTLEKANWAQRGQTISVRQVGGLFTTHDGSPAPGAGIVQKTAQDTFLTILRHCEDHGYRVSASKNSTNYAPKEFAARPDAHGINQRSFESAMRALMAAGMLHVVTYGKPSNPCHRLTFTTPGPEPGNGSPDPAERSE